MISVVILILRFFSKNETQFENGFFGKTLLPGAEYAQAVVSQKPAVKLFMTPSMIVFMALCVAQIAVLIVAVVWGGAWIELLG